MNRSPPEGDLWATIIEKAFAKINGNYENINWGWQSESFHILTGAPAKMITFQSIGYSASTAWDDIKDALSMNYLIGCDTSSTSRYNIPIQHAYTVMGQYELKDPQGNVVHRLFRVRNPWGVDVFNGPWSDGTVEWTEAFKAQVPYAKNTQDGAFFIKDTDFAISFAYYQIGYVHDDWNHSYYAKTSDDGGLASYTFTTEKTQELYVMADLYDFRMYPGRCKTWYTQGKL